MSNRIGITILSLLVAAAVLAVVVVFMFRKAENTPASSFASSGKHSRKTERKADDDVSVKTAEEKLKPAGRIPVEEKAAEEVAEDAVSAVAEEIGWEEAVAVEPPAEEPAEEPVVEKPRRRRATVTEDIGRMNPMGGDQLPTKEEAIEEAWNVINAYREASPEEKQQIAAQLVMAQTIMNGFAQNADMLFQQMPPESRSEVVNSASASMELLTAVQEEMAGAVTPEEAAIFGGVLQSLRNLSESFSNAAQQN